MQTLEIADKVMDCDESKEQVRKDRKKKMLTQVDSTQLRRSTHANKYEGFKAPSLAERRVQKSKVKPRLIPAAPNQANTTLTAARCPFQPPFRCCSKLARSNAAFL